jgi:hypothetical protein
MADETNTEDPDPPLPSLEGRPVPRAAESYGVQVKLETYSLDVNHKKGGPKARGFERILGITLEDIDYLEGAIYTGVQLAPSWTFATTAPGESSASSTSQSVAAVRRPDAWSTSSHRGRFPAPARRPDL